MWLEFWVSIYNLIFLGLLAMGVRIRQNACAFKALVLAFGPQGFLTPQHTICKKFLNIFLEKLGFHPWRTSAKFCCQDFSCLYQTKMIKCCFPWRVGCKQCKAQIGCHKSKQLDSIDGVPTDGAADLTSRSVVWDWLPPFLLCSSVFQILFWLWHQSCCILWFK